MAFFLPLPDNIFVGASVKYCQAVCFVFLLFSPFPAQAFRLDPMVVNVPVTSPQASATYTVENNTPAKIAVQFEVKRREIDENGKEERPPAAGFLIYPEQMALDPGQKRSVRVTWQGEKLPEKEQAFRFVASQLPVEFGQDGQPSGRKVNIKFLIEYVASLYLNPPKTAPRMKMKKYSVSEKGNLEILVANEGSAHQLLEHLTLKAKAGGKTFHPNEEKLKDIRTENLLPGGTRWLRLPLPKDFPRKNLDVSVEFE